MFKICSVRLRLMLCLRFGQEILLWELLQNNLDTVLQKTTINLSKISAESPLLLNSLLLKTMEGR